MYFVSIQTKDRDKDDGHGDGEDGDHDDSDDVNGISNYHQDNSWTVWRKADIPIFSHLLAVEDERQREENRWVALIFNQKTTTSYLI